jgi:hypothetical protein
VKRFMKVLWQEEIHVSIAVMASLKANTEFWLVISMIVGSCKLTVKRRITLILARKSLRDAWETRVLRAHAKCCLYQVPGGSNRNER